MIITCETADVIQSLPGYKNGANISQAQQVRKKQKAKAQDFFTCQLLPSIEVTRK
jgi:hypothetical protein